MHLVMADIAVLPLDEAVEALRTKGVEANVVPADVGTVMP